MIYLNSVIIKEKKMTTPLFLARQKNTGKYIGIFEHGNGGAWNDLFELTKYATSEDEAKKWFHSVKLNPKKWGLEGKKFHSLTVLPKDELNLHCAGQDYIAGKNDYFLIDNGFQTSFGCAVNTAGIEIEGKAVIGNCVISCNIGTRSKPIQENRFFSINPVAKFYCSHGAGRSSKEVLYLQKLDDKYELIEINERNLFQNN